MRKKIQWIWVTGVGLEVWGSDFKSCLWAPFLLILLPIFKPPSLLTQIRLGQVIYWCNRGHYSACSSCKHFIWTVSWHPACCLHHCLVLGPHCPDLEIFMDSVEKPSCVLPRWAHLFLGWIMGLFSSYFVFTTHFFFHLLREEAPHLPDILLHFSLFRPFTGLCCRMMLLFPAKSYCWNLTPNVMVLGDGVFERWWGHKGRAVMSGIGVLMKETTKPSLTPSSMWGHDEKIAVYEPGSGVHVYHRFDIGLLAPRTMHNEFMLLRSKAGLWHFCIAAQADYEKFLFFYFFGHFDTVLVNKDKLLGWKWRPDF